MKTALVTGGSSGIGQAIKLRLEEAGWQVIAPTHKDLDLSHVDTVARKAEDAAKDVVTLQAVIHVAGLWHDDQTAFQKDLEDYSPEEIVATLNVGLTGFLVALSRWLPKMSKDGAVIAISGTFESGASGWLPYYVSKRGLEDLVVGLSQDYPTGPRAYGVSPADTATAAYVRFFPEEAAKAQPSEAVAHEVYQLLTTAVPTGTIVEVRQSAVKPGFHV